jgi:hydroxyacylglutathione hydrolase
LLLQSFVAGPIGAVAYLVGDEAAGEAMVVDAPDGVTDRVVAAARERGLRIVLLVSTHGHWDHIQDNAALQQATGAPLAVHAADASLLERPTTAPFQLPFRVPPSKPDRLLAEGDVVAIGSLRFRVLNTPGHTPGCVCLYEPDQSVLLAGDTLFAGSYGRTDLPGGDDEVMAVTLARLSELPPETIVYPGHGPATTIGAEAWLRDLQSLP